MANVRAIRVALANQLQNDLGIRAHAKVPPVITPPTLIVLGGGPYIQYGQTMGEHSDVMGTTFGADTANPMSKNNIMLTILICISVAQGYEPMQDTLDGLLEPAGNAGSIPNAIAFDDTLGGLVDWAVPLDCAAGNLINVGGQDYFGSSLRVNIGA